MNTNSVTKDYSQHGEGPYLEALAQQMKVPELVVDIGARDGIIGSNSRAFLEDGWKGILIEPNPYAFKRLVENNYRKFNNDLLHVAVSDHVGMDKFWINSKHGGNSSLKEDGDWTTVTVKLSSLIHPTTAIGLLDIDAEGEDTVILSSILEDGFRPKILMIEANNPEEEKKQFQILESYKYQFLKKFNVNTIWTFGD